MRSAPALRSGASCEHRHRCRARCRLRLLRGLLRGRRPRFLAPLRTIVRYPPAMRCRAPNCRRRVKAIDTYCSDHGASRLHPLCPLEGCDRFAVYAGGYCWTHAEQEREDALAGLLPDLPENEKPIRLRGRCPSCGMRSALELCGFCRAERRGERLHLDRGERRVVGRVA